MVSISFYGGVGEVGGNKIFVKDGDTTVSLDFGMQMGKVNSIWSEFQQPRKHSLLMDLFEFDLLPPLPGLYRKDYTEHMQWKEDWKNPDALDAVILSHAHVDHCDYIAYLRPSIPVYCSPESKLIMEGFDAMSSTEYLTSKESFKTYENTKGGLSYTHKSQKNQVKIQRELQMIENHKKFKIGPMEFEPIHIDHSLPGTYGFLIYTSAGTIAYTADIRFHGSHPEWSRDFVKTAAARGVDLMLCEGTRLKKEDGKKRLAETESQVRQLVTERIDACSNLTVCGYPPRDLDRFMSFYSAVKDSDRKLAIDIRQAYTLKLFSEDPHCRGMYPGIDDDHIDIFIPKKSSGIIGREDEFDYPLMLQDYGTWARDIVQLSNAVNYSSMAGQHSSYALYLSDYTLSNLIDIRPGPGSTYIRSLTEPFNEEMASDHKKVKRWLVHFGLIKPHKKEVGRWNPIHVSGHGDHAQITDMVQQISPKRLIPIHTEYSHLFEEIHDSVEQVPLGQTFEW